MLSDVLLFKFRELTNQLFLLLSQLFGHFDGDLNEQVAATTVARVGHSFATQADVRSRLSSRLNLQVMLAIQQWDFELGAKRRLRIGNCNR